MAKTKVVPKNRPDKATKDPWSAALRILTRRDYSEAELRKRLIDRDYDSEAIEETIKRCLELGYLDDVRYAQTRATSLMQQGKAVGRRLLLDLRQRGINEDLAQQALEKALETCSEDQLLNELLARKFPDFNYSSAPAKERRRVVHFLQRRGFAISQIMEQLTRKGSEANDEDR
jgi:regulatory protein